MEELNIFLETITPGNYFLTKSMEITKSSTSGTLWYFKKFLVIYDAIFLSKKIRTSNGIKDIIYNFENYISTLPASQQEEAQKFFFPNKIDIRGEYKDYYNFAGQVDLARYGDINSFYALVDKYYFVYLMNIGGQSGVKAFIRDKIYNTDFKITELNNIIEEYKRVNNRLDINTIGIINDYPASLRNERQILFYFGFVHSRNNGAGNEREFASLTPIGELAVQANSKEFAIIWEHQKIKMISQPVTVEMPSIRNCSYCDESKFKLNFSPYISILKCINVNGKLDSRFYDFVLSRTNNDTVEDVIKNYNVYKNNVKLVKEKISTFGLRSDVSVEDFEKEIKKYMLGVRSDLSKDANDNYFGCLKASSNNSWEITDSIKLQNIVKLYTQIEKYKINKNMDLFNDCEEELRKIYYSIAFNTDYKINHKTKMSWDLYNINKDVVILFSLMVCDYILINNISLEDVNYNSLYEYVKKYFSLIIKSTALKTKNSCINFLKDIVEKIKDEKLDEIEYEDNKSIEHIYKNQYSSLNSNDLWDKIQEVSCTNIQNTFERKRDSRIISLMFLYYLVNYSDENNMIACECCGQTTFPKNNNEPFLEFHHLIPFNIANGPDHYENIFALCPMCHRKLHYIKDDNKKNLYKEINNNNHIKISIINRLIDLYKKQILKSYQLEYALSEQMISESEYDMVIAS